MLNVICLLVLIKDHSRFLPWRSKWSGSRWWRGRPKLRHTLRKVSWYLLVQVLHHRGRMDDVTHLLISMDELYGVRY